jgi:hypothetical protein
MPRRAVPRSSGNRHPGAPRQRTRTPLRHRRPRGHPAPHRTAPALQSATRPRTRPERRLPRAVFLQLPDPGARREPQGGTRRDADLGDLRLREVTGIPDPQRMLPPRHSRAMEAAATPGAAPPPSTRSVMSSASASQIPATRTPSCSIRWNPAASASPDPCRTPPVSSRPPGSASPNGRILAEISAPDGVTVIPAPHVELVALASC